MGVAIGDDGEVSYFAELEKTNERQRERIQEKREEKRQEEKEKAKDSQDEKIGKEQEVLRDGRPRGGKFREPGKHVTFLDPPWRNWPEPSTRWIGAGCRRMWFPADTDTISPSDQTRLTQRNRKCGAESETALHRLLSARIPGRRYGQNPVQWNRSGKRRKKRPLHLLSFCTIGGRAALRFFYKDSNFA